MTWFLPEKDRTYVSKAKYLDEIATLYGGRVAEEIFFGKDMVTTGASNDIERATDIARAMITRYGFDEELGAENFASDAANGNYLGSDGGQKIVGEHTQQKIDEKVRLLLAGAYQKARSIVEQYQDIHVKVAEKLLEKEELLAHEFDAFFEGKEVPAKAIA